MSISLMVITGASTKGSSGKRSDITGPLVLKVPVQRLNEGLLWKEERLVGLKSIIKKLGGLNEGLLWKEERLVEHLPGLTTTIWASTKGSSGKRSDINVAMLNGLSKPEPQRRAPLERGATTASTIDDDEPPLPQRRAPLERGATTVTVNSRRLHPRLNEGLLWKEERLQSAP